MKKLTITLDERVYEGLHRVIRRENMDQFIENLLRPHVDLALGYQMMGQDEARESEAFKWTEAMIGDGADDSR